MADTNWTPGPWEAVEATEHHGFYVTSAHGNTLCDLYTMSNPRAASVLNGGDSKPIPFMHEMDGPNAHLIAAAPELYEALDDIIVHALADIEAEEGKEHPNDEALQLYRRRVTKARAALAKARGEQVAA